MPKFTQEEINNAAYAFCKNAGVENCNCRLQPSKVACFANTGKFALEHGFKPPITQEEYNQRELNMAYQCAKAYFSASQNGELSYANFISTWFVPGWILAARAARMIP